MTEKSYVHLSHDENYNAHTREVAHVHLYLE